MKRVLITIGVILSGAVGGMLVSGIAYAGRNSSGTYTLSTSGTYPFVSGTTISSASVNGLFSDVGTEITDSLSRSGKGGMTAPLRVPDGAVSAPTLAFTNETGTGLYRIGSSNPAMSVSGSKKQEWTSTGTAITGTLSTTGAATIGGVATAADGSVSAPAHSFTNETSSGLYRIGSSDLGVSAGGTKVMEFAARNTSSVPFDVTALANGVANFTSTASTGTFVTVSANGAQVTDWGSAKQVMGPTYSANDAALGSRAPADLYLSGQSNSTILRLASTGAILNSKPITGLAASSASNSAATRGYVDDNFVANGASPTLGRVTVVNDLYMAGSGAQAVVKNSGTGGLQVGTNSGNGDLTLFAGGPTRFSVQAATGNMVSTGGTVTGLPTPSASSDAATKGYVDSAATSVSVGTGSISWASGWSDVGATSARKGGSLVVLSLTAGYASGGTGSILTLPSGYRPTSSINIIHGVLFDQSATVALEVQVISSTGEVRIITAPTAGHTYIGTVSFFTS